MTAVYDKLGLKFLYPENWKLIDDAESESRHVVTLETPDGSCSWAVHVYPANADRNAILKEILATMQETYEDLEVAKHETELGGQPATGVETMFYCLDFLIRAQLHFVETEKHLLLFESQAEDREFDKHIQVFQAISFSLLQSLTAGEQD